MMLFTAPAIGDPTMDSPITRLESRISGLRFLGQDSLTSAPSLTWDDDDEDDDFDFYDDEDEDDDLEEDDDFYDDEDDDDTDDYDDEDDDEEDDDLENEVVFNPCTVIQGTTACRRCDQPYRTHMHSHTAAALSGSHICSVMESAYSADAAATARRLLSDRDISIARPCTPSEVAISESHKRCTAGTSA